MLFYQLTSSASRLAFGIGSDPYGKPTAPTPALSVLCCGETLNFRITSKYKHITRTALYGGITR